MNDYYVIPSLDIVVVRQGSHNTLQVNRWLFVKTVQEMIVQAIPLEP